MSAPQIHKHDGGDRPVAAETLVRVKWRNGYPAKQEWRADQLRWRAWPWGQSDWDIVAWRHA